MRYLSEKTKSDIINFVNGFYRDNGFSPTITEISASIRLALSTVHKYLHRMNNLGEISFDGRHIVTDYINELKELTEASVIGDIACGTPVYAEERIGERLLLPKSLFGTGDFFLLCAKGNSMINIGIEDGDHVIIRRQSEAKEGDVVVALTESSTTLKTLRFDRENRRVRLVSENDDKRKYPDQIYDSITVQGVYVGVIKKA